MSLVSSKYSVTLLNNVDEILVNASDNYQRDHSMNLLKVEVNQEEGKVSVWNNGKGIPCVIHKEHGVYVPELIFGNLLTSSNYNDTEKKVTGGRNGYGAKLANIFSTKFIVEAADEKNGKLFVQEYSENMSKKSEAKVSKYKGKDYTCITFYPDLKLFGMDKLDDDMISLIYKRVHDIAGITPDTVKVFLNGERLKVKSFSEYVDFYLKSFKKKSEEDEGTELPKLFEHINNRWEFCVSMSDGQFQQVSFVNGICTIKGGTHVNAVTDQVVDAITAHIQKKHKLTLKPHHVKASLWVFVNALIENPTFDSQTKETLTLKPSAFGSEFKVSDGFIKKVLGCGIIETLVAVAQAKDKANMAKQLKGKKRGRLLGIEKLEDANWAGTKKSSECFLIVTEGDSAKGLAMNGVEVLGRDRYGVFPLRGKMLNVRDAKNTQVKENKEINDLIQIFGLQFGATYEDVNSLRYGGIVIMTDQDVDGSHIKGLVINFFQAFWPSLFKLPNFLTQFITPIIKATKGKQIHQFFTLPEYEEWAKDKNLSGYRIKYYKGLGTSTPEEAKEYFRSIDKHKLFFEYVDEEDDEAIVMAFGKKNAEKRKDWINSFQEGTYMDYNKKLVRYKEFVDKELIQFSMYDNMRSIPSVCDGLKPGQRKILYACFKRNLKTEIKVAQLSGYVSEHSAYHHGETSLASTIVGMAQDFVGSNNINLLLPIGQFGTRHMGGKEAASARYIYTSLSKLARVIFRPEDDAIMKYQIEEGQRIEPEWYLPIIPMILVNGAEGIGTGWRTTIPNYNPREIVANLYKKMKGEEFSRMCPWFKNYTGRIEPNESKKEGGFICYGSIEVKDEETVTITELPIWKWTREYKTFLEECFEGALKDKEPKEKKGKSKEAKKKKKGRNGQVKKEEEKSTKIRPENDLILEDIKEYHIGNRIHFEVKGKKESLEKIVNEGTLFKAFKLTTTLPITQYVCFDHKSKLKRYTDELEIMEEFYELRLQFYEKRKVHLLTEMRRELGIVDNKVRFILGVINEEIIVRKQKKKVLVKILFDMKFVPYSHFKKKTEAEQLEMMLIVQNEEGEKPEPEDDSGLPVPAKEYDYLLSMPLWSLTYERVEELLAKKRDKELEIEILDKTKVKEMWSKDLEELIKTLDEVEQEEEKKALKEAQNMVKGNEKTKKPRKKKEHTKNAKKVKKKADNKKPAEINKDTLGKFLESQGDMNKNRRMKKDNSTQDESITFIDSNNTEPEDKDIVPLNDDEDE